MSPAKTICAMHDLSSVGRSALTAIIPTLSAMGVQTIPAPTAVLSAHTAFPHPVITDLTDYLRRCTDYWQEMHIRFDCIYTGYMSSPGQEQIAQKLFSPYGARALEVCSDCIDHEYEYIAVHGGSLYPGVEALLNSLKPRHKLYIVSNCQCGYIECFTGFTGLGGCFDGYECSGSTGLSKGENIRLVVQRAGLSSPVYVGDTHMDELSAREAGLPFIHAAYGFGSAEKADAVLRCPLDLLDIIGD